MKAKKRHVKYGEKSLAIDFLVAMILKKKKAKKVL
jgi:hypothetical protein